MNFFWLVFWDSRNQKTNAINISLLVFGLKYLIPLLDFFYFSTTWARWTWPSRMFNSLLTLSFIVKFKGKPHWTKSKVNQELHQVRTSATTEGCKTLQCLNWFVSLSLPCSISYSHYAFAKCFKSTLLSEYCVKNWPPRSTLWTE